MGSPVSRPHQAAGSTSASVSIGPARPRSRASASTARESASTWERNAARSCAAALRSALDNPVPVTDAARETCTRAVVNASASTTPGRGRDGAEAVVGGRQVLAMGEVNQEPPTSVPGQGWCRGNGWPTIEYVFDTVPGMSSDR